MPDEKLLVIAVDGLRATALGAYGNTAFSTPALDELAAQSLLLDSCFADAPDLASIYRALWCSQHPLRQRQEVAEESSSLPRQLADHGGATVLVTDDATVARLPAANDFGEIVRLEAAEAVRARELDDTHLARLFAEAGQRMAEVETSEVSRSLVWVHSRGMYGPWDAPLSWQEPLLAGDEGDPAPCDSIAPPDLTLRHDDDPDIAFRWSCGYAAQTMVLDACMNRLLHWLVTVGEVARWQVMLLGVRGFPLGEHHRIGGVDGRLYVEQQHVPWLWRLPDGRGRLARSGSLASHLDLLPTLIDDARFASKPPMATVDGLSLKPRLDDDRPHRDALVAASSGGVQSVRSAGWSFRRHLAADDDQPKCELFVRPDDRWEANDVASLCPDEVAMLSRVLDDSTERLARGEALPRHMLPGIAAR